MFKMIDQIGISVFIVWSALGFVDPDAAAP